jgi:hypothetical protein
MARETLLSGLTRCFVQRQEETAVGMFVDGQIYASGEPGAEQVTG